MALAANWRFTNFYCFGKWSFSCFLIVIKQQSAVFRVRYRRSFDEPISVSWRALSASCNKMLKVRDILERIGLKESVF